MTGLTEVCFFTFAREFKIYIFCNSIKMKYNNSKLSGCIKQKSLEGVIEMLNKNITIFGDAASDRIFIQMVDEHDLKLMESEIAAIKEYTNTAGIYEYRRLVSCCSTGAKLESRPDAVESRPGFWQAGIWGWG